VLGPSPPIPIPLPLIADTGSTGHFLAINTTGLLNTRPTTSSVTVRFAGDTTMSSTHMADLDLPSLPPAACVAHLFPALKGQSLLSVGQLCDAGCDAHFTATTVTIDHQGTTVLTGHRDPASRLWIVGTTEPTAPDHALLVNQTTKPAELVAFAHGALFSPALSTLQTALDKNYLTNFPGLTSNTLRRHPPQSSATIKGTRTKSARTNAPHPSPPSTSPYSPSTTTSTTKPTTPFRHPDRPAK
jgi:hypothetical protein